MTAKEIPPVEGIKKGVGSHALFLFAPISLISNSFSDVGHDQQDIIWKYGGLSSKYPATYYEKEDTY